MPDVLGYLRFTFSYSIHIVASAPKLSVTVFELQIRDLFIDPQTALTFQQTHAARDCKLRRDLDEQMNRVGSTLSFDNGAPFHSHQRAAGIADIVQRGLGMSSQQANLRRFTDREIEKMSEPVQLYTACQYVNTLAPTQSYSQLGNFYGRLCPTCTKLVLDFSPS